ncbi:MAG: hypothetical protein MUP14_02650 [Dehalococcoidia bacterium]|nr:hypothetical protein [Dehalococcoidia bacterium]
MKSRELAGQQAGSRAAIENKKWVRNFVPGSTSERILAEFAQGAGALPSASSHVGITIDPRELRGFLLDFKGQTGLREIDLLELREYAQFRTYGLPRSGEKDFYEQFAEAVQHLVRSQGIRL